MQDEIPAELKQLYIDTSRERAEEMSQLLAALDPAALQRFAEIAHNLKGTGGTYGIGIVSEIGARLDAVAKRVQEGALPLTPPLLAAMALGVGALREAFLQAASGEVRINSDHQFFSKIEGFLPRQSR